MPAQRTDSRSSALRLERWYGGLTGWLRRHGKARPAGKAPAPIRESSAPPPAQPPASRARVLVTVLGLSGRALEDVLELVSKGTATKPIAPVFITDVFDFAPFRQRRLPFEYVPDSDRQQRFAPDLDWDVYLRRRYALLSEKWQAKSVVSFGRPPPRDCVVDGRPARQRGGLMVAKRETTRQ
jgi:hypothetical protein